MAAIRWTLGRLDDDLAGEPAVGPARALRAQIDGLQLVVGHGPAVRAAAPTIRAMDEWVTDAVEAMGWFAENRCLGGASVLDGLAWDLVVAEIDLTRRNRSRSDGRAAELTEVAVVRPELREALQDRGDVLG